MASAFIRPLKKLNITQFNILRGVSLSRNMEGAVQQMIREKLESLLQPAHLEIINESYKHNVPKGSETHFKVIIISDNFKDKMLVKRHQMIYDILKNELSNGVHALSIVAKTPDQWENSDKKVDPSPPCLGGGGK